MSKEHGCDDNFAVTIAALIGKHPALYYSMQLEDSNVPHHAVRCDILNGTFCDVFKSYNSALFDCVRLMIRYEKFLAAWRPIIDGVDDKVTRDTLIMDYVHPTFTVLCDLPNMFKDRLVRGCVKLASVSKGDYSYLSDDRRNWFKSMEEVCGDTELGRQMNDLVDGDLYKVDDAKHFIDIHGAGMHDLLPTLVSGTGVTMSPAKGVVILTYNAEFDLGKELEIVDRHRRRIQDAYMLFGQYGDALYDELLAQQRSAQ